MKNTGVTWLLRVWSRASHWQRLYYFSPIVSSYLQGYMSFWFDLGGSCLPINLFNSSRFFNWLGYYLKIIPKRLLGFSGIFSLNFWSYVYGKFVWMHIYAPRTSLISVEARTRHLIAYGWSYRQLWGTMLEQGTELWPTRKPANALNHWAIAPVHTVCLFNFFPS